MHIAECLTHSTLGGGQAVVFTLVRRLIAQHPEIRITVMLPDNGIYVERFKALGIDVETFPFNVLSPANVFTIRNKLRTLSPDVIHSHGKGAGFYCRLGSAVPNAGMIHSYHGFHPPAALLRRSAYLSLERFLLSRTDRVVAVSEAEALEIRGTFGQPDKVIPIPNAVDCDELWNRASQPLHAGIDSFLQRSEGFLVAMIGRNDPVKNYPLALRSAGHVLERKESIRFVFVGLAPEDPAYVQVHEKFPRRVYAVSSIEDTPALLSRSNALLLTSKKEGSPLVVREAFCFGKPVVGTDVEGIRDHVRHGTDGLLCRTEYEIAEAIVRLADDATFYNVLAENARNASHEHSVSGWAERYCAVYSRLEEN